MLNLIQADLYKLWKSTAIKVLLGITVLSSVLMTIMAYEIPKGNIDKSMTGVGFMFSDVNVMSILGAVIASILICGDFENKGIPDAIASGCSRSSIIVSKTIAFCCSIAIILLPYAITAIIALCTGSIFSMGSVSVGLLNVLTSASGNSFSAAHIWKLLAVILTLAVVYGAQLSLCIPLAFSLKKPVFVVAIYYAFTILSAQLSNLSSSSSVFKNISSCTPYGGNYSLTTLNTSSGGILKAIAVSLIFTLLMIAVTYSIFRKSEVK